MHTAFFSLRAMLVRNQRSCLFFRPLNGRFSQAAILSAALARSSPDGRQRVFIHPATPIREGPATAVSLIGAEPKIALACR
jgi:hypothetical protein